MPLASVRLSAPIPKAKIFDVMNEIRKVKRTAPVHEGEVVIENVLELGAKHKKLVKTAAKNKKLQLDFSGWATETPKAICYSFEES